MNVISFDIMPYIGHTVSIYKMESAIYKQSSAALHIKIKQH